jgi:glycosyltransferase involved in cell wall biosynthesis
MIILHAAAIMWGKHSGPSASVPGLVMAQNAIEGVHAAIIPTIDSDEAPPRDPKVPVFHRKALLGSPGKIDLPAPFDRPDLVVFHSTYIPMHARIASRLRRAGIPYLICPRGGMTRGATNKKRLKKRLGNLLFFNRLVHGAAAVHCLTEGEAALSSGWDRPTFVVGNGIPLPPRAELANVRRNQQVRLTFMGRLDIHHKGLDLLLDACRIIRRDLADANALLALHGPDTDGSVRELHERIATLGLDDLVSVGPPVSGASKAQLLKRSDGFLHTSRYEGLPMAVLEALAHGVPCLLTPGTNMADEVARFGAGWKVETTPSGVAAGIKRALSEDRNVWVEAGRNARRLVKEHYRWDIIGKMSVEQYRRFAG